ncbi:MAG: recombination mediator protein UvsY [Anaerolineaceae bacterium]
MTLEEIEKEWEQDAKIDETNLVRASSDIPKFHSKYYKLLVRSALKVKKLKGDLTELERLKFEYYNGSLPEEDLKAKGWKPNALKILRADIPRYIDSDKDIIDLSMKISYHSEITKFLEDIIRQVNNRNFIIKSMIDFMKFSNGGY